MDFFWSLRRWIILFLLRITFSWHNQNACRRFVKLLSFLLPFDQKWVQVEDDRGMWIAEDIGDAKKEAISDAIASSHVVLLWVPGGGFRVDLSQLYIKTFATWIRALEADKNMKCTIFVAKYRLGPEHPFPAAVDDLKSTYEWLVNTVHVPPSKLIVGADDAGASVVLDLLYLHKPQFQGAVFASPYTGLEAGGDSWRANGGVDYLNAAAIDRMEESYIPQEGEQPFRYLPAEVDLGSFLPRNVLITVGGNEVLLDEAGYIASRARESGARVTLVQSPEQLHLWAMLASAIVEDVHVRQYALDQLVVFTEQCMRTSKQ
ncbi:Alpha/Beta hydrolase protein [Dichotomocladium elegans]|nr:Alpha/Beta hydrolase protein [Dichotomocladium elegans]